MKTWVKYGAAIMGLLIVSALIISFGMKKEESYRDIKVMSIKGRQRWNGQVSDHWMLMKI